MKAPIIVALSALLLLLGATPASAQEATTVTLLHFSDYHSHAVPFFSEGEDDVAGAARAIAYLKQYVDDPNVLILSGGDMINKGSPAWSDKYGCVEWSWFNGLVQAMAYGNHDADYGSEIFAECLAQIDYPMLASNVLDAEGEPIFQHDGRTYELFDVGGVTIGVFAVAGPDFERLLTPETMPVADMILADRIETARETVQAMEAEGADAIVLIGHGLYEDDLALAQAVPGIDLIFGTHSHRKEELTAVPDSDTVIISPYQYLTYISQVDLTFVDGELQDISGELVEMSSDLPEDPEIKSMVDELQAELQADPDYAYLYEPIGEAADELATDGQFTGSAGLGNFVTDVVRKGADANMAIITSSTFRQPIPPGVVLEEDLLAAMPYKNAVLTYAMTGAQIKDLLDYSISRSGSDFFSQVSGVTFAIVDDAAADIRIAADAVSSQEEFAPLDPEAIYQVATSNFQGLFAGGYQEIFAQADYTETGLDFWDLVRSALQESSPVHADLVPRIVNDASAAQVTEAQPAAGVLYVPREVMIAVNVIGFLVTMPVWHKLIQ
ncbi:MAG: 5'-nucleotidase C-terminal domain-containing protein [Caldilineaceae bacterium]|nr:5'-nucleotidase C-terminal domain-containing protein [Caldilineaceae bacterium]